MRGWRLSSRYLGGRRGRGTRHVAHILLHGHGGKQTEQECHRVETLLAVLQGGIPQADRQQQQGQQHGDPAQAKVNPRHGEALAAVAHGLLLCIKLLVNK